MSTHWKRLPERGTPFAVKLIGWIALRIGRPVARALLYPIVMYFMFTAAGPRRGARAFLRRALNRTPRWSEEFRHLLHFGGTLLDRLYFVNGQFHRFDIRMHNGELPEQHSRNGKGCILLGSHLGSFESARAVGISDKQLPVRILMHVDHNPMMSGYMDAGNSELAQTIIPIGKPESLLAVKESLEQGYMIGILADRVFNDEKTSLCRFFGHETAFPAGPLILASTLKAPVILFYGLYQGGNRYDIHFELLAERVDIRREHREADIRAYAQRYADRLEHHARQSPYNWFNFYDFWEEDELSAEATGGRAPTDTNRRVPSPLGEEG